MNYKNIIIHKNKMNYFTFSANLFSNILTNNKANIKIKTVEQFLMVYHRSESFRKYNDYKKYEEN